MPRPALYGLPLLVALGCSAAEPSAAEPSAAEPSAAEPSAEQAAGQAAEQAATGQAAAAEFAGERPVAGEAAATQALRLDEPRDVLLDWAALRNPILESASRLYKDPAVVYHDGWFYVFTHENHRSRDLRTFEPLPTTGSQPDVTWSGSGWIMAQNGGPQPGWKEGSAAPRLRRSLDLLTWSAAGPLLPGIPEERNIDPAIAWEGGFAYIAFKREQTLHVTRVAEADLGTDRYEPIQRGSAGGLFAEQFQLIKLDGVWHMVATSYRYNLLDMIQLGLHPYTGNHHPFLYTKRDAGADLSAWTTWEGRRELLIPRERWNRAMHANGGHLVDRRAVDGYYYLFYAGSEDHDSFDRRGHDKIGVARSRDLVRWVVPGDTSL